MSFKVTLIDCQKDWPRLVVLISLGLILYLFLLAPTKLLNSNDAITSITNIIYIFLTFELLRSTRQTVPLPYLGVKFLAVSDIEEYIENNIQQIKLSQTLDHLRANITNGERKNCVFAILQNLGEVQAIDIRLNVIYKKFSLGESKQSTFSMSLGNLKKEESIIVLLEVFDGATNADYILLQECDSDYHCVQKKLANERSISKKLSIDDQGAYDDSVVIKFQASTSS